MVHHVVKQDEDELREPASGAASRRRNATEGVEIPLLEP